MKRHLLRWALFLLAPTALTASACGGEDDTNGNGGGGGSTTSSSGTTSTGSTSSSGGTGGGVSQGGGGGAGGGLACVPVSVGPYVDVMTETGGSDLLYELTGLDAASQDLLFIEFYDVSGAQTTGAFDLAQAPDDQYQSCAHCVVAYEDFEQASPPAFFQESGTLHVTTADTSYTGESAGSFENVKLIEVTIAGSVSTPVPGGRCLLLNGTWDHTGGG